MRNAFVTKLTELCRKNSKIVLLVGDIGFGVFEDFKKEFPRRYFNMGIAEQNSIGVVSGLAKEGFFPIFYTIIPFLIYRPFEQIRNDLCINRRKALLVGVGSGLSYGALGPTHHALEDIGVLSVLPEIAIYTPSSPNMVANSLEEVIENEIGPAYLRLGKNGEPNLKIDSKLQNSWFPLRVKYKGNNILILTHGTISKIIEDIIDDNDLGCLVTLVVIERIKPFPKGEFYKVADGITRIIVIEEHYEAGGLFDHTLRECTALGLITKIESICLPHKFIKVVGSQENLLEDLELNKDKIYNRILHLLDNK